MRWLIGPLFWVAGALVQGVHAAGSVGSLVQSVHATGDAGTTCPTVSFAALSELDRTMRTDEFAIHYTLRGSHAIVDQTDRNGNRQPDVIDDLALQLTTARTLYSQSFGLRHPLQQPRYAPARQINVFVLKLEKGNGLAFDEVVGERVHQEILPCALRLFVGNNLRFNRNVTAAHELFHLYQYGYSMFKSRWYLEGMARWVELAFREERAGELHSAASPRLACEDVYASGYTASAFWAQHAQLFQGRANVVPDALSALRYSDGSRVLREGGLPASQFLLPTLRAMAVASAAASEVENLPPYRWPEKLQTSDQFDSLICDAVRQVNTSSRAR